MKLFCVVCAAIAGFAGLLDAADPGGADVLPKALPAARYEKLARQNPFILPTAPVVAPVSIKQGPKWSDGLTVAAVMQQGEAYVATVVDRNTNERFSVGTDPEVKNSHDIALATVKWADTMAETTVMLRKGSEFFQVKYEPAAGGAPAGGAPGIPANPPRLPTVAGAANRLSTPTFNGNPLPIPSPSNAIRRQPMIRATPPANPAVGGTGMRLPVNTTAPRPPAGIRPPPGSPLPVDEDDDE